MKVVILAGGLGTRIAEESETRPKPMIEIGGMPILWHVMKIYAAHGFDDFVICLGYKGFLIKEYFANYMLHRTDVTFDFRVGTVSYSRSAADLWRVTLIDTGVATETGGRLRRLRPHLEGEEAFCMTYGDGVADVDIAAAVAFHKAHGKLATVTAVQPAGRFGAIDLGDDSIVRSFVEKPRGDGAWINGGFFVLSPRVIDYIAGDSVKWEEEPLRRLAAESQLKAYRHEGFWHPMDTMRDKRVLDALCADGRAPWMIWSD